MPSLLIDARNVLYRAVYAGKHDTRHEVKYHNFVILLRQIVSWIRRYNPESVHVFWDAPRKTIWRCKALKTYKDRSKNQYLDDIGEDLAITTKVASEFFKVMNVRQYSKREMEADDLIYAAASVIHPSPTVVVSTDSDMIQIPFTFSSSAVFDPYKRKELDVPAINPAFCKALTGDKSDLVDGYYGIGPKRGEALLLDKKALTDFLKLKGSSIFYRNLLLIDLSANPRLLANRTYILRRLCENVEFSKDIINSLINKYKVNGLLQEYSDLIPPFKKLV